jgi:hypothetical protein
LRAVYGPTKISVGPYIINRASRLATLLPKLLPNDRIDSIVIYVNKRPIGIKNGWGVTKPTQRGCQSANRCQSFGKHQYPLLGQFVDNRRPSAFFRPCLHFDQLLGLEQMSQRQVDINPTFDVFFE